MVLARVAVAVVVALLMVACDSSTNMTTSTGQLVHWTQTDASLERRIDVIVPSQFATSGFMWGMAQGVAQANRSPYIAMRLTVEDGASCSNRHCVVVTRRPMNGGLTSVGYTAEGHMSGLAASIAFDSAPWQTAVFVNAACHELHHAVGLGHSVDGTPGPCQDGVATPLDLDNVARAHAHADRPSSLDAVTVRTSSHSRAFYAALG